MPVLMDRQVLLVFPTHYPVTAPARPPIQGLGPEQERLRWWLGRGAGNPALARSWIPAGQWSLRVQYPIARQMSLGIIEQNVGTSMLDRLQGLGELPEAMDKSRKLRNSPNPWPRIRHTDSPGSAGAENRRETGSWERPGHRRDSLRLLATGSFLRR